MKKIVVLTGAGISAESGISTFRDADGLWEGYNVMDVASPMGWAANKETVLKFYNERRKQLFDVNPNTAHTALAELQNSFDVTIITQNVDDLHERAGSKKIIHLHGELLKARSTVDQNLIYDWKTDIKIGDLCEKKSQLRPHIVWFYEDVPLISEAVKIVSNTDILIVIGTSMQVYPAADLINCINNNIPVYFIDPKPNIPENKMFNLKVISEKASVGVPTLVSNLIDN